MPTSDIQVSTKSPIMNMWIWLALPLTLLIKGQVSNNLLNDFKCITFMVILKKMMALAARGIVWQNFKHGGPHLKKKSL